VDVGPIADAEDVGFVERNMVKLAKIFELVLVEKQEPQVLVSVQQTDIGRTGEAHEYALGSIAPGLCEHGSLDLLPQFGVSEEAELVNREPPDDQRKNAEADADRRGGVPREHVIDAEGGEGKHTKKGNQIPHPLPPSTPNAPRHFRPLYMGWTEAGLEALRP
jgi:hypothetical protein